MNLKIIYSYDGSKFHGSQRQPDKKSVENILQNSFNSIGIYENLISSSRTDKGVHALNQVSTIICPNFWDLNKLVKVLNKNCHPHIHIKNISIMKNDFHPRYDAKFRSYRYIINHQNYNPFLSNYCYFYKELDLKLLNRALSKFIGKYDFVNFMKTGSDNKTTIRNIYKSYAYKYNNYTIIKFKADGFLRAQVRLMIANAIKEIETEESFTIKKAITRNPAPPNGLYLERIFY
ncbi:tRNA pseudouridine(38-40) synthase [Campylobacter blaseri]|uniref:tRNA pseudouridine synthase A n=1 Tax=Campylobacter blaseri TaxID=2042961 RepID=A0A2P8R2C5_9BACT|nr:tRNA pseudouridine(38-40) synthase TruA [Campylobacter blaseri]PSM52643.1 tRNA pseudouridine(38-40) synthase TruA [Campylobacter blaseri]PSM54291.1 tRNA pseudouridine(38-40) synthase TruA [Campylobacter blaseri]QKF85942.1 tRNA pseudouridine(38-40) synthase [Campylobacter blaseri]